MRFGVNYTPSTGWFHHWLDFDIGPVRADLDSIAELGADHVRVFPIWPVFQPNRTLIRPAAVRQLESLVDAAAERGLDVVVDGLQGHLSSFDFRPSWTSSWHRRNLFTDTDVVDAQARYLATLSGALADRPNFLGMVLGNEFNQFSDKPHPDPDPVTQDGAEDWLRTLLDACERGAPGKFHTHCEYDASLFAEDHPFLPAHAANLGAATVAHSWVFNGTAQRHGPTAVATTHHAEYQLQLLAAWSPDPDRPLWLQEVGAPAPHIPPELAPDFAEATVRRAATCAGLYGITWWCSHDVDPALADFPELEYGLGLLTNDRRRKPIADRLAEVVAELRAHPVAPEPRPTGLVLELADERTAAGRSATAPGGAFAEAWQTLAAQGVSAAVVLGSKAADAGHLAGRGITTLLHPKDVVSG